MIKIPHLFQDENYTCGPTTVKMICDYFQLNRNIEEIKSELNTNENGTRQNSIVKFFNNNDFKVVTFIHANIEDVKEFLNNGYLPIINFLNIEKGHYAIVINIDEEFIYLCDPRNGPNYKIEIETFFKKWHNGDKSIYGWVAFIKTNF